MFVNICNNNLAKLDSYLYTFFFYNNNNKKEKLKSFSLKIYILKNYNENLVPKI